MDNARRLVLSWAGWFFLMLVTQTVVLNGTFHLTWKLIVACMIGAFVAQGITHAFRHFNKPKSR